MGLFCKHLWSYNTPMLPEAMASEHPTYWTGICQSQPCNTHFAAEGVPMANSTFLLGVGPANIHSQFHLIYHVWWLEVSWSAGLALSAGKDADSISTYLFWLF